jgi:hypothetical protein
MAMIGSSFSARGFNILSHQVHEELTRDNLLLWKAQVLLVVHGAQFMRFLDGTHEKPEEFIIVEKPDKSQEEVPNPAYASWVTKDSQLLGYLNSTISKEVLTQVATLTTPEEVWKEFHSMYMSQSRSRVMHLHSKLASTRKGDMTVAAYSAKMKGYADEMTSAGKRLEDDDVVSYILTGLNADYNPLVDTVNSRSESISLSNLYTQLLLPEAHLENQSGY